MGYRSSWVAFEGPLASLLAKAGWRESGQEEDFLDTGLYGLELPKGWALVIGLGWEHMDKVTPALAAAAAGNALYLLQSDTSMTAVLIGFVDGQERWSIVYDASEGVATPTFNGEVPRAAAAIWDQCQANQRAAGGPGAGVDYHYELVPELGLALTGFRHDQDPPEGVRFKVLDEA